MRILLLSFHFPPAGPTGSTRVSKLAKFLLNQGHDLRVMCADDPQEATPHASDFDPARVIRTGWQDARAIPSDFLGKVGLPTAALSHPNANAVTAPHPSSKSLRNRISNLYDAAVCKPDRQYGWRKSAHEAARALFQTWVPDVIYACCPPHSTSIIAAQLSQICGAPFVTEFSERWAFNGYSEQPKWRKRWDKEKEFAVLRRAAGIVTGSPLWAESYARRFGADKVALAMTGFDPERYPLHSLVERNSDRRSLHLCYTGSLIPGRRDPRLLFKGIAALGDGAKDIHVTMIGNGLEPALEIAEDEKIHKQVTLLPSDSHDEIIEQQYAADALMLPLWNDARDAGTIPDTLFECIAVRRPVIASGYSRGVCAEIVRRRGLGVFSNEPKVIANTLAHLLARKRAVGTIAPLPESVRSNATCDAQFAAIDPLLHRIADVTPMLAAAE